MSTKHLPTLYALTDEFCALLELIEDSDLNKKVITQEFITTELERVAGDIKIKAYGIAAIIQGIDNKAAMLKAEEARLNVKRKMCENTAEQLRAYTLTQMINLDQKRIDTGTFVLSVRTNPPSVVITNIAEVPHEFERTKITIDVDKRAILEQVKATGEIPAGVEIQRVQRLVID